MEKLYYEFDEKEVKNTFNKLFYFLKENNEDIEKTSIFLADEYINGNIKLETYLQSINMFMYTFEMNKNSISMYEKLLPGILKIKEYMIKNNIIDENIYELLIYIYDTNYNFEEIIKISEELLKINNKNKMAILHLVNLGKEIDYASKLVQNEFKIIDSIPIWVGIYNYYTTEIEPYIFYIRIKKDNEETAKLLLEKYKESRIKIDENLLDGKNIIKKCNEKIDVYKKLIEELKPYNGQYIYYFIEKYNNYHYKTFEEFTESNITLLKKTYKWHYELACIENCKIALLQSNLGCAYLEAYKINNDIEYRNNGKKLFEESIKNYLKEEIISIFIKDPIINLVNIYDEEKEYKKAYDLIADIIYRPTMIFKDDCDLLLLEGEMYYKKDKNKKSAKKAIEDFRQAIDRLKYIDTSSFKPAMEKILNNTIPLIYEMEQREFIHENNAKTLLQNLYFYHTNKPEFYTSAYITAYNIEAYDLCRNIISLLSEEYMTKNTIEYYIKATHYSNIDNTKELLDMFNNSKKLLIFKNTIIYLINECAKSKVLEDINIENKNVLIDIYEIMSNTRKELVIMRLFDYVRNADAYANKTFNKDMNEEITNKVAKWKGEDISIKYNNKEYVLCYHFHSSNEIEKDVNGNIVKDNRGKPLRRLPDKNWIAINQIRDSLAHRVNEKTSDVNEEIINAKKAREFIDKNYTAILECLFNVIKENHLFTDKRFRSDEF
ncbi:hypothetical protein [Brachyspira intermedia]|uniref:hypothetical protein n=1 Tax=Brachyspira intermedia TaxID=84377 RepID=UPI0030052702